MIRPDGASRTARGSVVIFHSLAAKISKPTAATEHVLALPRISKARSLRASLKCLRLCENSLRQTIPASSKSSRRSAVNRRGGDIPELAKHRRSRASGASHICRRTGRRTRHRILRRQYADEACTTSKTAAPDSPRLYALSLLRLRFVGCRSRTCRAAHRLRRSSLQPSTCLSRIRSALSAFVRDRLGNSPETRPSVRCSRDVARSIVCFQPRRFRCTYVPS